MGEGIVEKAVLKFMEGFNCAEAVLMAFAESIGVESMLIPKVATGFGGGIGRGGSVCGALLGAVMAIGLQFGRNNFTEAVAYEKCMAKSLEIYRVFERSFGTVFCRELTQCDLTTREGVEKFKEQRIREHKCVEYVRRSMEVLQRVTEIEN